MTDIEERDLLLRIAAARRNAAAFPANPAAAYVQSQRYNPIPGIEAELGGVEETNVPGTLTAAVGQIKEHPVAGSMEIALSGLNPGFFAGRNIALGQGGNWLSRMPGTAALNFRNALSNEAAIKLAEQPAAQMFNPEEHPWMNLAANMALFGGMARTADTARMVNDARKAVLGKGLGEEIAASLPSIPGILNNETGAVSSGMLSSLNLWDKARVGEKLSALGDKIGSIPLLPKDSRMSKFLNGNTFSQWVDNPVLRMPEDAGNLFRRNQAESERISQAYQQVGLDIDKSKLNLEQLEDLRRVLRGGLDPMAAKDPMNQQLAMKLLKPVNEGMVTGKSKLVTSTAEEDMLNQGLTDRLLKIFVEDPDHPLWQAEKAYTGAKFDLTTRKGTEAYLDHLIKDPTVDPLVKQMARDHFDLAAKTAQEVASAHSNAYTSLLREKVINNPDWSIPQVDIRTKMLDAKQMGDEAEVKRLTGILNNYVEIPRDKAFDGLLVHKTVAEGINDFDRHVGATRKNWNKYFLNPWKFSKIGLNPVARPRDAVSGIIFNDVAGEFPLSPFRVDIYGGAIKDLVMAGRGKLTPEMKEFLYWTGGRPDTINSIALDPIFDAMKHGANPIDSVLGAVYDSRIGQWSSAAMKNTDLWTKYAKFKWNLKNGMNPENAAYDAMNTVGDHTMQTSAVRAVRDTAMPFFGWQVHALKTMAHGFAHHPVRAAKWFAAPYLAGQASLQDLNINEDEWRMIQKTLPEYLSSTVLGVPTHIPMPVRDEKGRIQLIDIGWWLPGLQDLSEMNQNVANPIRFVQNPAATLGASLMNNQKFSGAPIWNEWDDPTTKVAKFMGYAGQQLLPPMTPFLGNQFQKIYESYNENNPDALTPMQAWGSQIGYRATPFEEGRQMEKFQKRQDAFMNEAKHQFKEDMRKARSESDAKGIQEEFQKTMERLARKKALE